MKRILLVLKLLFIAVASMAQHIAGSEISYRPIYTDSTVYEVSFKVYFDLEDSITQVLDSATFIRCKNGSTSTTLSPTLVEMRNKSGLCATPDSFTTGMRTVYGYAEHLYLDTIDFGQAMFSNYAQCSETYIELRTATRRAVDNIDSGAYYNRASLFLQNFSQNSAGPSLSNPLNLLSQSYGTRFYNVQENTDQDSLSFRMVPALTSPTDTASYKTGYQAQYPFEVFFPSGYNHPYNDPTGITPHGFYFDTTSGDMIFTPVQSEVVAYVIEATEWRRNASGILKKAGIVRREVTSKVFHPEDNLPFFDGLQTQYTSCIGQQNTIDLKAKDYPFSLGAYDTLAFAVISSQPIVATTTNASYSGNTTTNGTLTWNTNTFDSIPPKFDAIVIVSPTNKCFGYNYTAQKISIENYAQPDLSTSIEHLGCGKVRIAGSIDTFNNYSSVATITVHNSAQQLMYFGFLSEFNKADTLKLREADTYYVETTSSFALACDSTVRDTFSLLPHQVYPLPKDSNIIICHTDSTLLLAGAYWESVLWNTGDTTPNLFVSQEGTYTVTLTDSCGDTVNYAFHVTKRDYHPNLRDTALCPSGIASYGIQPASGISWVWPNNITDPTFATAQPGDYILNLYDSVCGYSYSDSFSILAIDVPVVTISPQSFVLCKDSLLIVRAEGDLADYVWSNGSRADTAHVYKAGPISVIAQNACGTGYDTVFIDIQSPPIFNLANTEVICRGDSVKIGIEAVTDETYVWSTGETTPEIYANTESFYTLTAFNRCGFSTDSIMVFVEDTPSVFLGPDTAINEFDIIRLANRTPSRFATYQWNIGSNADSLDVRLEGTYWLIETNVCGSDTDSITIRYRLSVPIVSGGELSVYPIPASSELHLKNTSGRTGSYCVRSIKGKAIKKGAIDGSFTTLYIDNLQPGLYFLETLIDQNTTTIKFIVN